MIILPSDAQPKTKLPITAFLGYLRTMNSSFPDLEKKFVTFLELVNMDIFDGDFEELRQDIIGILERMKSFEVSEKRLLAVDHGINQKERDTLLQDIALDIAEIECVEGRIRSVSANSRGREKQEQYASVQEAYHGFLIQLRRDFPEEMATLEAVKYARAA
jgi:hypothetical protein